MDYVIELTYPVGESISEGLIMTGNQLFGVIGTLVSDFFMEYIPKYKFLPNLFFVVLQIASFICILFIGERLKRHEKDIAHSERENRDSKNQTSRVEASIKIEKEG